MTPATESLAAGPEAPLGTPQASSAEGASPLGRSVSRGCRSTAEPELNATQNLIASTPNLPEPVGFEPQSATESGTVTGDGLGTISLQTIIDGGGRAAGGDGPCSADSTALLSGLVGKQTSDKQGLQSITFTASDQYEASRELARSARMRKLRLVVGHHADTVRDLYAESGVRCQCIMVTLTYAPGAEYSPRQVTEYVKRMRAWLEQRKIAYAYEWVLEMQKRGAPHYHVLWWIPVGMKLPMPDSVTGRQRKRLWPWGLTRIEIARSGPAYIVKYASKGDQDRPLPRGARLYGVGGFDSAKRLAQWRALPAYVRDRTEQGSSVRRATGGGWLVRESGEHIPSEWETS
jgi:hypothetical protein